MIDLGLDWETWDLTLNANGDIAVYDGDNAIAQSCAHDVRLFTHEAYFDQNKGIPHFDLEFDHTVYAIATVVEERIQEACLAVEGVVNCYVTLTYDKDTRTIGGEISIETVNDTTVDLEF